MPIQDNNPERRNLLVSSIAFLAYFWGGGHIKDGAVRLPVVNIEFEHQAILAVMAWVMLFWFAFRYWLGNSGLFAVEFRQESAGWVVDPEFREYISSKVTEPVAKEGKTLGWHIAKLRWDGLTLKAVLMYVQNVNRGKFNEIGSHSRPSNGPENREIAFDDISGRLLVAKAALRCFGTKQGFSNYIVPYMVFGLAVLSGVVAVAL